MTPTPKISCQLSTKKPYTIYWSRQVTKRNRKIFLRYPSSPFTNPSRRVFHIYGYQLMTIDLTTPNIRQHLTDLKRVREMLATWALAVSMSHKATLLASWRCKRAKTMTEKLITTPGGSVPSIGSIIKMSGEANSWVTTAATASSLETWVHSSHTKMSQSRPASKQKPTTKSTIKSHRGITRRPIFLKLWFLSWSCQRTISWHHQQVPKIQ